MRDVVEIKCSLRNAFGRANLYSRAAFHSRVFVVLVYFREWVGKAAKARRDGERPFRFSKGMGPQELAVYASKLAAPGARLNCRDYLTSARVEGSTCSISRSNSRKLRKMLDQSTYRKPASGTGPQPRLSSLSFVLLATRK